MEYGVRAALSPPALEAAWTDPPWDPTPVLDVACFRPEGSAHRPRTLARLLHSERGIHGIFRVEDRYVRCVHTRFQDPVYEDSCVEVFLQPDAGSGYFNFEFNCGGALLASHVTDHRRTSGGLAAFTRLRDEDGRLVERRSSLPPVVDPEIPLPLTWELAFLVPIGVLERHVGPLGPLAGQEWRANLHKCADRSSHPHWASWSPVDALNFHLPHSFGTLRFEPGP
jgi:hypothetical protein